MTVTWGLVATVKAPEEQLLAFIAHHLSLGAAQLWIYFDDPADPAFHRVANLPRVTAIRCTDWYWAFRGGRDSRHQKRQSANARHAQRTCKLDWLGHIDVDEFLYALRPVADLLGEIPADMPNARMAPFEALHDPDLPDDIFTARYFRGVLDRDHPELQLAIFGPTATLLKKGSLSHALGKSFCRPRFRGLSFGLHTAFLDKVSLDTPFHPELRLLHFHAQDPVAWRRSLPLRLSRGAYHHPEEAPLKAYLGAAKEADLERFYATVMTLTPEKLALLQAHDRLVTTDLGLRDKVAALLAGAYG